MNNILVFLRFLVVGGGSALVQFLVLGFGLRFLPVGYQFSVALAYIASVCFHFLANRRYTFQMQGKPKFGETLRYSTIVLVNFIITLLVTTLAVELAGVDLYIATFLSIVTTIGVTFIASKYWIFVRRGSV